MCVKNMCIHIYIYIYIYMYMLHVYMYIWATGALLSNRSDFDKHWYAFAMLEGFARFGRGGEEEGDGGPPALGLWVKLCLRVYLKP